MTTIVTLSRPLDDEEALALCTILDEESPVQIADDHLTITGASPADVDVIRSFCARLGVQVINETEEGT